jgi:hypothetical protein
LLTRPDVLRLVLSPYVPRVYVKRGPPDLP